MSAVHRCERGPRCYAHETLQHDGQTAKVGKVCDRSLCDVCEAAVARALDAAPGLYLRLRAATLIKGASVRSEMVSASRGSPLPLNGPALHLGEQLWWLLVTWEDEVRRIARLTPRAREGVREGRQVVDAARFLAAHLTAWIAAPTTPFQLNTGRDPHTDAAMEQTGAQAAGALLDWRSHARNQPGVDRDASKAVRRYEQRCPACGVRSITHVAGDDLMQCQNCGATQEYMPSLPREADFKEGAA